MFAPVSNLLREDGTLPCFTEVGCYNLTYLDVFGAVICPDCANKSEDVKGGFVYWEGPSLQCDECGAEIESEYGDPKEE